MLLPSLQLPSALASPHTGSDPSTHLGAAPEALGGLAGRLSSTTKDKNHIRHQNNVLFLRLALEMVRK